MTQLRTIEKQICVYKNPKVWLVLFHIPEPCCILQATVHQCVRLTVRHPSLQHPNRDICYLHLMVYRMQPLDLRGAMGTKKTIKAVKHQRRPLNTKRTMKDYKIY